MTLKIILIVACVLVMYTEQKRAIKCKKISGSLKQIDASVGLVYGVNSIDKIYTLSEDSWVQVPGSLQHISVGPSGVWGVDRKEVISKFVESQGWIIVPGSLKQVDAGGDQFIVGVNNLDDVYYLDHNVDTSSNSEVPWIKVPGSLSYYSCGPIGCWGINKNQDIWMREGTDPTDCMNSSWQKIEGKLVMIEVGTGGSVYGVNAEGNVYRRDGITDCNHAGTEWTMLSEVGKAKHVSYDMGSLWVITPEDNILKCAV